MRCTIFPCSGFHTPTPLLVMTTRYGYVQPIFSGGSFQGTCFRSRGFPSASKKADNVSLPRRFWFSGGGRKEVGGRGRRGSLFRRPYRLVRQELTRMLLRGKMCPRKWRWKYRGWYNLKIIREIFSWTTSKLMSSPDPAKEIPKVRKRLEGVTSASRG